MAHRIGWRILLCPIPFLRGNAYVDPRDKILKCPVSGREGKRKTETLGSCIRVDRQKLRVNLT